MTRKRKPIIYNLKSKYWQQMHKYVIRAPRSDDGAYKIDGENGYIKWTNVIRLNMNNFRVSFEVYEGYIAKIQGYQEITGH